VSKDVYLAGASLVLKGACTEIQDGMDIAREKLGSDEPLQHLARFIELSGGNKNVVSDYSILKPAQHIHEILAQSDGFVSSFDTASIGNAAMIIGAGRKTKEDEIDHSVGLILKKKTGDKVKKGEGLVDIYYNNNQNIQQCIELLQKSIVL
jgi:pyrimidine-nucleoside phosphorylase